MNPTDAPNLAHVISAEVAWKYRIIPTLVENNKVFFHIDAALDADSLLGEIEVVTGYEVILIPETTEKVSRELSRLYRKELSSTAKIEISPDSHSADLLLKVIAEAKELHSSDIHIEGYSEKCRIRLRIDGKLIERYRIPKDQYPSFINKIKIKANLDIAEKRLPQDGRILLNDHSGRTDIRVSVLPSLYGEKIVLRILGTDSSHLRLDDLGFDKRQLADVRLVLKKLQGIVLISGPTGSGKTTTLYSILKLLNNEHSNILTVEDPIEYTLDGINQVQLRENIGLTFSSALRTFLRQDPDIIMLGEIRDAETAQMAIRAALTGHLVLSTIHTNSAWGTVSRLVDMGVPAFLLSSTLNLTIAQRLVRKLCNSCKTISSDFELFTSSFTNRSWEKIEHHHVPVGCNDCYFTGYSGRNAIYEVIPIDRELSLLVKENALDITTQLKDRTISRLQESALNLVMNGITSFEEIYPILLNH